MPEVVYSDGDAKDILEDVKYWPQVTSTWNGPGSNGVWIRGNPKGPSHTTMPKLKQAGSSIFKIDPDGMWIRFRSTSYADVIVFEVSRSGQNLNDKRSRYLPQGISLVLEVHNTWLNEKVAIQGGAKRTRITLIDPGLADQLNVPGVVEVPVRFLRAVFVVPNELYRKLRENFVPAAHEFFMRHNSLKSGTSQKMQVFL